MVDARTLRRQRTRRADDRARRGAVPRRPLRRRGASSSSRSAPAPLVARQLGARARPRLVGDVARPPGAAAIARRAAGIYARIIDRMTIEVGRQPGVDRGWLLAGGRGPGQRRSRDARGTPRSPAGSAPLLADDRGEHAARRSRSPDDAGDHPGAGRQARSAGRRQGCRGGNDRGVGRVQETTWSRNIALRRARARRSPPLTSLPSSSRRCRHRRRAGRRASPRAPSTPSRPPRFRRPPPSAFRTAARRAP